MHTHYGRCLHLDLHGFASSPDDYDVIMGTNHRKTVQGSDIDVRLHTFLTQAGYRVYLPTDTPQVGERFMAATRDTEDDRLVHVSTDLGLTGVVAIQLEIARRFRTAEVEESGKALAKTIGKFVMEYSK